MAPTKIISFSVWIAFVVLFLMIRKKMRKLDFDWRKCKEILAWKHACGSLLLSDEVEFGNLYVTQMRGSNLRFHI